MKTILTIATNLLVNVGAVVNTLVLQTRDPAEDDLIKAISSSENPQLNIRNVLLFVYFLTVVLSVTIYQHVKNKIRSTNQCAGKRSRISVTTNSFDI